MNFKELPEVFENLSNRQIPIEISPVLIREFNNCYILLLNSLQTLENTGFIALFAKGIY